MFLKDTLEWVLNPEAGDNRRTLFIPLLPVKSCQEPEANKYYTNRLVRV